MLAHEHGFAGDESWRPWRNGAGDNRPGLVTTVAYFEAITYVRNHADVAQAAPLAVADDVQSGGFLHGDDVSDSGIEAALKLTVAESAADFGTQQIADELWPRH